MAKLHHEGQRELKRHELPNAIQGAVKALTSAYPDQEVRTYFWNEAYVAIRLHVNVNVPTRGPVDGIDIRDLEPILLLAHRTRYPHAAPDVVSDRSDFPRAKLPHVNLRSAGAPTSFCLHRGSIDDWFAEHDIVALVERARKWLSDAASKRLIRDADEFEATRIEDDAGFVMFDPVKAYEETGHAKGADGGHQFVWYSIPPTKGADPLAGEAEISLQRHDKLEEGILDKAVDLFKKQNATALDGTSVERGIIGIVAWPKPAIIYSTYLGHLPRTFDELRAFANDLNISLDNAVEDYTRRGLHILPAIPVTFVIPRGRRLIQSPLNVELLNFLITKTVPAREENAVPSEAPVRALGHRQPLTRETARQLSGEGRKTDEGRLLLLGCGALGSKLALHRARRGQPHMSLVDPDILAPHNMARHALLSDSVGKNKAKALAATIVAMYTTEREKLATPYAHSALDHFTNTPREEINAHALILDATAARSVLEDLINRHFDKARVARAELADDGRLGILAIEGVGRNPRLDDIHAILYDEAIETDSLSAWLQRSRQEHRDTFGSRMADINLGLSCSADTTLAPDDAVSIHASIISTHLRDPPTEGKLILSRVEPDAQEPVRVEKLEVPRFADIVASNDSTWRIRLPAHLKDEMHARLGKHSPKETGGILVGFAHKKRRIIYVTRLLEAPPDSRATVSEFMRGTQGLPDNVRHIEERTGLLGYVGEWHTHPNGVPRLSTTDKNAIRSLMWYLKPAGVPTHVIIVTPKAITPYVFPP